MNSNTRITLAFLISISLGLVTSLLNGQGFLLSIRSASAFSIIVTFIVAILSWGMDIAKRKGYSEWLGFLMVLVLNIFGLLLLAILPKRTAYATRN